MKDIVKKILRDIKVELADEFDKNFERKGFFDQAWSPTKHTKSTGSLMMRTGALRRSIKASVSGSQIKFTSSEPYASLHNDGGAVKVTVKMKRFFWAMHRVALGKSHSTASGRKRTKKAAERYNKEAAQWKSLALKKVGTTINVTKRQFIGWHNSLTPGIKHIVETRLDEALADIAKKYGGR